MYLLKLRRDETIVPSTLLWTPPRRRRRGQRAVAEAPAQPAAPAPAAARRDPRAARRAAVPRAPGRAWPGTSCWSSTRRPAWPPRTSPRTASRRPRRPRSRPCATCRPAARSASSPPTGAPGSWSTRRPTSGRVRQALDDIETTRAARGDLGDALELAGKLAARSGRRPDPRRHRRRARDPAATRRRSRPGSRSCPSGASARTRRSSRWPSGPRRRRSRARSSSASRTSTSSGPRGGSRSGATAALIEVRDLQLEPQARSDVVIDDVPRDVGDARAPARRRRPDRRPSAPDQLAVDDHAWAIVPPDRTRLILVVGPGDPYLETALSYLPNVELFGVDRSRVRSGHASARTAGRGTSSSSRAPCRRPCHGRRSWPSRPTATSPLGEVTGTLTNPGIGSLDPDEPILRYVDLSTTHIASAAQAASCPTGRGRSSRARRALPCSTPGSRAGLPTAVLAFEPRKLRPAAPGRLPDPAREPDRRAARRLRGADRGRPARDAGRPHDPGRCDRARPSTRPDGSVVELVPGDRRWRPASRSPGRTCPASTPSRRTSRRHRRPRRRRARAGPTARPTPPAQRRVGVPALRRRRRSTRTPRSASRSPSSTSTNRRSPRARPPPSRRSASAPAASAHPPDPATGQGRRPRPARPPATSCGSRSSCSSSSACASSGRVYHRDALIRLRRGARRPVRAARPTDGEHLMGISFDAPLALLLLIPALLLTIGLHLGARRRMGSGRRRVGARRSVAPAGGARLRPRRVPAGPAGRPARDRLRRRPLRFGRQRGPRGRARLPARDARGAARRRRGGHRRVRQGARWSSGCRPT